ncbi:maleylpyruvate isomerase family mycothiol-dependent enzyme [Leucobacter sp. CSA1]|uniref:Maleylpyruvate isomerase family mycothiol-dependent enzyme n=1 Tax=Leucobacter chromiisoli TaxID=2796471 RepID=A0A934UV82_9MICO|nr:maleylpyruvate isomerase family mycothiol-dependent enzyme [Leucobacter chromiisoli]MBK0420304.1 maleylpyruvate isomerase family mycothiol-dependent enzyme [Leucobacter chromiisoli]
MRAEAERLAEQAIEEARAALRARQGSGARYDAPKAPAAELDWARRGTAYFARKLTELPDDRLREPSLVPGWTRAELIAHVGYNARALTRLTEWASTGVETPMYLTDRQRDGEILLGGTLPPRALRTLFAHSEAHLNVEWRDLTDEQWDREVRTAQGRLVPARETAWMRAREVWVHAVDLGNGGSFLDFPPEMITRIIDDVLAFWRRRGEEVRLRLEFDDGRPAIEVGDPDVGDPDIGDPGSGDAPVVSGAAPDIARWLSGRGARRLACDPGDLPAIPRWF